MAHILIAGQTMSGKTTFAKQLARQHRRAGRLILSLDPMLDPDLIELSDYHTTDPEDFLRVAGINTRATCIIDEGGETVGQFARPMFKLATQYRHIGHICLFLVQRPAQINPTIRGNTAAVAAFALNRKDAAALADEYNCPDLVQVQDFPAGRYIYKKRFQPPVLGRVF